ncbi:hypothetical protein R3P38DRAFT_3184387 [Favolaschia claudopus]|uniref:Uncharacterized protein n=1 Tax=Favolaschia claudopus TaxID=2862362 RepID=A0AAW0B6H8_9AGAR
MRSQLALHANQVQRIPSLTISRYIRSTLICALHWHLHALQYDSRYIRTRPAPTCAYDYAISALVARIQAYLALDPPQSNAYSRLRLRVISSLVLRIHAPTSSEMALYPPQSIMHYNLHVRRYIRPSPARIRTSAYA